MENEMETAAMQRNHIKPSRNHKPRPHMYFSDNSTYSFDLSEAGKERMREAIRRTGLNKGEEAIKSAVHEEYMKMATEVLGILKDCNEKAVDDCDLGCTKEFYTNRLNLHVKEASKGSIYQIILMESNTDIQVTYPSDGMAGDEPALASTANMNYNSSKNAVLTSWDEDVTEGAGSKGIHTLSKIWNFALGYGERANEIVEEGRPEHNKSLLAHVNEGIEFYKSVGAMVELTQALISGNITAEDLLYILGDNVKEALIGDILYIKDNAHLFSLDAKLTKEQARELGRRTAGAIWQLEKIGYTVYSLGKMVKDFAAVKFAKAKGVRSKAVPDKARDVANHVKSKNGAPPQGYKGGRQYNNIPEGNGQKLPEGVKYREYDVNPYIKGQNRGMERIVIGDDGSVWYTNDHYTTFTKIE